MAELISRNFDDHGQALINPGMGWCHFHYDNGVSQYGDKLAPSDTLDDFPGLSVVYLRLAWAYLEPAQGDYAWSWVDTPSQRWIAKGKQIALRITCCETGMHFATPRWVYEAGSKGYFYSYGKGVDPQGKHWEPDYNDPVFLEKHEAFVAAMAKRYDGDPTVAFIDVGSFGVWGEGHTFWSSKLTYDADTIIRHIDLYRRHFHKTLLVSNWTWTDHGRGPRSLHHAEKMGLTFRTDSILVLPNKQLDHPELAAPFWPDRPIILESAHFSKSVRQGVWGDGSGYAQALEDYHGSYVGIHAYPREFLAANQDLVARMNRRMGYRLQLQQASWPERMNLGEKFEFIGQWCNAGVASCLPGGHVAVTIKDEQGGIAGVWVDESWNVRDLPVAAPGQARTTEMHRHWCLHGNLQPGTYRLFVSVGSATGTPQLALPLHGDDGQHRYQLGLVQVDAC